MLTKESHCMKVYNIVSRIYKLKIYYFYIKILHFLALHSLNFHLGMKNAILKCEKISKQKAKAVDSSGFYAPLNFLINFFKN